MLVGFSGGMDSALLAFLLHKRGELTGIVHYIYKCRSDIIPVYYREKDFIIGALRLAERTAKEYNVPFIFGGNTKSEEKNEECMWREERYSFFESVCRSEQIAIGHHFDDQFDSFLLHLLKNTQRCFIPYSSTFGELKVIRPLLGNNQYSYFTKENIRELNSLYNIKFLEDPTNSKGDRSYAAKANLSLKNMPNYYNRFIKAYKDYRIKESLSPDSSQFNLETIVFDHV